MAICGISLHLGSSENRKTLEQSLFFKSALLIPTNAFHSTNLFMFFNLVDITKLLCLEEFCVEAVLSEDFPDPMAAMISSFSGGAALTSRSVSGSCAFVSIVDGGLFRTLLKYSTHLASCLPRLFTIGGIGDLVHMSFRRPLLLDLLGIRYRPALTSS